MKKGTTAPRIRTARLGGVEFEYIGGNPVLDFHNTIAWPGKRRSNERLRKPVDLVRWAAESGIITNREAAKLRAYCLRNALRSRVELAAAIQFRDLLHNLFSNFIERQEPAERSIGDMNRRLKRVRAAQSIEWRNGEMRWSPLTSKGTTTIVDRVALRAADLITAQDRRLLRRCKNSRCGWVFLDTTRNGLRKWCSMAECGGRAKANRYYESHKTLKGPAARTD